MAALNDYTSLITSEHRDLPRFAAVLGALVQPLVDQMNVLQSMPGKFDLDDAVGVQLDDVGLWVGVSRKIRTPLTGIYFSFDVAGLGFDQGIWKGPFDPDTGLTVLDDDTYRLVIRAKIGANHWDGTLESSAAILNSIFGNLSGDLVPLHANGEVFGTGDGVTKNFPLTYGGAQVRRVDSAALYRNDWQGDQPLYPTARTNILKYSEDFTQSAWTKSNVSITANATTAPDGRSIGQKMVENTANGEHYFDQQNVTADSTQYWTRRIWVKGAERTKAVIKVYCQNNSGSNCAVQFDTSTGTFAAASSTNGTLSYSAMAGANGWWLITFTTKFTTVDTALRIRTQVANAAGATSYTGDGTSGIYFQYQDLELGTTGGSYIPTTTAAASVTDYAISSSGVAQLAGAPSPGAKLSWTGDGALYQQGTRVFIEDHQDMSMTIGIAGKVPSAIFLALLAGGYIPLKPEGVRVNYTIVTSVDTAPLFGFDVSNEYIAGFDTGAWGTPV
ncbi:hypothetical protein WS66_20775 [Burkholderia sp. LA-2-3-30-S1-D2]|nr:hypothetical protein WS66_20775 [Burkholderia sp. LA-2-3-30-S1-D2]KVE14958.1 hypothetical protein WS66_10640 [Burkholderia sp. LA-2-3-30-S1-D2]